MRLTRTFLCAVLPMAVAFGAYTRGSQAQSAHRPSPLQSKPAPAKTTAGFDAARDRSLRRRLHRLLSVRVRRVDEEQSDPRRAGVVGTIQRAGRAQPRDAARPARQDVAKRRPNAPPRSRSSATTTPPAPTTSSVEALGAKPLADDLARIAAVTDKKALPAEIGTLQRLGINVFFSFGAEQDFKESSSVIAIADQGGLGLPDRDYYFKTEENFVKQREQYVEHVRKMFVLAGDAAPQAAANAKAVMTIETALAKNALDLVTRRDPNKIYHRMTRAELARADQDVRSGSRSSPRPARRSSRTSTSPSPTSSRASTR